jgi:hypothetical protein
VDVWHTIYQHPMDSAAAIVQWLSSTGLKPFVEGLPQALQAEYLSEYQSRIDAAYPVRADGKRLLAFPDFSWWLSASHDERTGSPATVLLDAQGGAQRLPVCDHYSGVEARMRKSLQLQAEMMAEFGTCVFDVTLDCEDGAPVGQEAEHARLAVAGARCGAWRPRGGPGACGGACAFQADMDIIAGEAADKLCHIMIPKVESVDDVHQGRSSPAARDASCRCMSDRVACRRAAAFDIAAHPACRASPSG